MAAANPQNDGSGARNESARSAPMRTPVAGWASALGAIAVVLGLLLTATHANEWMKQAVIANSTPAGQQLPTADCPADELEEEGLSLAECEHLVARVQALVLSQPEWFAPLQRVLSAIGTFIAAFSVIVGIALVSGRGWAPRIALLTFAALLLIDAVGFIAVVNTGPITRGEYLWSILLWFALHLMMTVAVVAGRDHEKTMGSRLHAQT